MVNCGVPNFSRARLAPLQELAARILDTRAIEGNPEQLARELLAGFSAVCLRWGLDALVDELALDDHPELEAALAAKLANKAEFDPRGPRNAKPKQLVDCVLGALGVTVVDEPDRTITLGDEIRAEVGAAFASVLEDGLAPATIRADIIKRARAGCAERHLQSFDKITAQLDDHGAKLLRTPKVPIDALQATQHLLSDARHAAIAQVVTAAFDRAKPVLARASAEAADRIDQPITLRLTPREVAIERAADPSIPKTAAPIAHVLLDSLRDLAHIAWRSREKPVRAYSVKQTFAVGDLLEHPKFGRGTVTAVAANNVEVEFADGKHTLVHARVS